MVLAAEEVQERILHVDTPSGLADLLRQHENRLVDDEPRRTNNSKLDELPCDGAAARKRTRRCGSCVVDVFLIDACVVSGLGGLSDGGRLGIGHGHFG